MKVSIILLAVLPLVLSMHPLTPEQQQEVWNKLSHEDRNALTDAVTKIKNWLYSHGKEVGAASCSVACASVTVVETLGLSAPLCAAACGIIGLFG